MFRSALLFSLRLLMLLIPVLGIHLFVLAYQKLPLTQHLLIPAYWINALLAIIIFGTIVYFKHKLKNALGFLFMAGSLLKFGLFFLVFYPTYKSDGHLSALEFSAFFVPYLVCLLAETYSTTKMLNQL